MPCRDEGQGRDHDSKVICELQERLDKVTRLLCDTLKANADIDLTAETVEWWKEHQKQDKQRRKEEKIAEKLREQDRQYQIKMLEAELLRLKKEPK